MIRWGHLAYSIPLSGAIGLAFRHFWWAIPVAGLAGLACLWVQKRILAAHEAQVRGTVAEQLREHAAGHRRTAKRAGVMRFELVRRAQVLEAEATRIARPAPAQTTAAHTPGTAAERTDG